MVAGLVGWTPEVEALSVPHMASGHPISPGEAKGTFNLRMPTFCERFRL